MAGSFDSSNWKGRQSYSPDVRDIHNEPQNVCMLIMAILRDISLAIPRVVNLKEFDKFGLIQLKYQLRDLHSYMRIRSNLDFNRDYRKLQMKFEPFEGHQGRLAKGDSNDFLAYMDLLMEWKDLEVTLLERFNLTPAEDVEFEIPEIPEEIYSTIPIFEAPSELIRK